MNHFATLPNFFFFENNFWCLKIITFSKNDAFRKSCTLPHYVQNVLDINVKVDLILGFFLHLSVPDASGTHATIIKCKTKIFWNEFWRKMIFSLKFLISSCLKMIKSLERRNELYTHKLDQKGEHLPVLGRLKHLAFWFQMMASLNKGVTLMMWSQEIGCMQLIGWMLTSNLCWHFFFITYAFIQESRCYRSLQLFQSTICK